MARPKKEDEIQESAIIAEASAAGNPHRERIMAGVLRNFRGNRKATRVEMTAAFHNERDVYAINQETGEPVLLAKAGWSLSAMEKANIDLAMENEANRELNEWVWEEQENQGVKSRKGPAEQKNVQVLTGATE